MKYQTLIDRIGKGSVRETARLLDLPVMTVNNWRLRGVVPHWRQDYVRSVADRLGVDLDETEKTNA